jgi:hypothetical protein
MEDIDLESLDDRYQKSSLGLTGRELTPWDTGGSLTARITNNQQQTSMRNLLKSIAFNWRQQCPDAT